MEFVFVNVLCLRKAATIWGCLSKQFAIKTIQKWKFDAQKTYAGKKALVNTAQVVSLWFHHLNAFVQLHLIEMRVCAFV